MNILFLLFISFKYIISNPQNKIIKLKKKFMKAMINQNQNDKDYQDLINDDLLGFFGSFPNFDRNNQKDVDLYNYCTNNGSLFDIHEGVQTFLRFVAYSGNELSDLGQELSCVKNNFSYYLFSYNYISDEDELVYNFLEKNNFYTGICLYNNCLNLFHKVFDNYEDEAIKDIKIYQINNEDNYKLNDCENNLEQCNYLPYYTLNDSGIFDKTLTLNEKSKYQLFYILIIIIIVILCIEIIISIIIYCRYNSNNYTKNFTGQLYEESDIDYGDDENSEDENEEIILSDTSSSKRLQKHSNLQKLIIFLYKYFSFFTKVLVLSMRKSKYYNNKSMKIIINLRVISLLLITLSTNFDVYIKNPSKGLYDNYFFEVIYFIFLKIASFGLDIYICLDGFEVMYKLMNFYKKNCYEKNNEKLGFKGILKFYLFSIYKIIGYIILFFIVNYFSRYYVYMHKGDFSTFYSYYSMNFNNNNDFGIFNPKYSILGYLFAKNIDDKFLKNYRISLLFINEFYVFTFFIIIFYFCDILKSKKYDIIIFVCVFASFVLSYPLCAIRDDSKVYTYHIIVRSISLVKFPFIFMNHYFLGAFTGLICFYLKESTINNSMTDDPDKCPFKFILSFIEYFGFLFQKRKILLFISYFIQFLICIVFNILFYFNDEIILMELVTSLKIIYYYEAGLFILIFCFNIIIYFADEIEAKNTYNYSLINLINQINFSYVNTIYLMVYSYYCYFGFQLKFNYQNLILISLGLFLFFCVENIVITILFIMPFKIIFKSLLDNYIDIRRDIRTMNTINETIHDHRINNSGLSNELDKNCEEDNE